MADDRSGAAPEPTPQPDSNPIGEVLEQITASERLVVIGAAVILFGAWFLGEVLFDETFVARVILLLTIGALVAVYFFYRGRSAEWHPFYPWLLGVIGVGVAVMGIIELLEDTRFTDVDGATWLFRIVFYVGAALMGVGGVQTLKSR